LLLLFRPLVVSVVPPALRVVGACLWSLVRPVGRCPGGWSLLPSLPRRLPLGSPRLGLVACRLVFPLSVVGSCPACGRCRFPLPPRRLLSVSGSLPAALCSVPGGRCPFRLFRWLLFRRLLRSFFLRLRFSPVPLSGSGCRVGCRLGSAVGFSGSRRAPSGVRSVVASVASALSAAGRSVFVGCASGVDAAVRSACPSAVVFSVASGRFGAGRSAFSRRSAALVSALPAGSGFLVFPSGPCPVGVVPAASWRSGSPPSGSWSSAALAVGRGLSVFVFGGFPLPAWPGGSWSPASVCRFPCFRWVPVSPASQLSLFS